MGAFPNLSRNVPFCPLLSSLGSGRGGKRGQKRTKEDKTGQIGKPPFGIHPHLALLKILLRACSKRLQTKSLHNPTVEPPRTRWLSALT